MPPRRTRTATQAASSSRRRRREPSPPPSPPPSPLPWELEEQVHQARYRVLHKREIVPSRFFHPFTVHHLGLRDDINTFVQNIGWSNFAALDLPTYKEITYEILSTLTSTYHPNQEGNPICISFSCLGETRHITMQTFNDIFGFPNNGITWFVSQYSPTDAWYQLTGHHEYNPRYSKSTHIRNHSLRYLHRVMAFSIFGRGESFGVVNKTELLFLWAMTNGLQVNTGAWFLKHLLHIAKSSTGKICVGGLLTAVAQYFGFVQHDFPHPPVPGTNFVDIAMLLNMRLCRQVSQGQFRLLDDEGHIIDPPPEDEEEEDVQHEDDDLHQQNEPHPEPDEGHMGEFNQPQQPPWPMTQIMERFDQLELRQMQMMDLLQRNTEAITRIEDKLSDRT